MQKAANTNIQKDSIDADKINKVDAIKNKQFNEITNLLSLFIILISLLKSSVSYKISKASFKILQIVT